MVVPAVAPVEQAVVVLLDFAGKEDEQAAGDEILDSIDQGGHLDAVAQSEEVPSAEQTNDRVRATDGLQLLSHLFH